MVIKAPLLWAKSYVNSFFNDDVVRVMSLDFSSKSKPSDSEEL